MQELILIGVIAVIVIGPKQLPEVARALGKGYAEFRRAFDDMKRSVDAELRTEDLKRSLLDVPPPPPPPPPGGAAAPPAASLLTADPFPYPEVLDGGPPPPETAAAPAPPATPPAEEPGGRA